MAKSANLMTIESDDEIWVPSEVACMRIEISAKGDNLYTAMEKETATIESVNNQITANGGNSSESNRGKIENMRLQFESVPSSLEAIYTIDVEVPSRRLSPLVHALARLETAKIKAVAFLNSTSKTGTSKQLTRKALLDSSEERATTLATFLSKKVERLVRFNYNDGKRCYVVDETDQLVDTEVPKSHPANARGWASVTYEVFDIQAKPDGTSN